MLQIKKITVVFIDPNVECKNLREALNTSAQAKLLEVLLGIIAYVEKFDVKGAYRLYQHLSKENQKLVNPHIAEMLNNYELAKRLRGSTYAKSVPQYDVTPVPDSYQNSRYN